VKNVTDGKLLQENKNEVRTLDTYLKNPLENFEKAKFATKSHGLITSYSANTHQGIQRNYNEDRVSIILNMTKPANKAFHNKEWPKCSFFAIYDGHGGNACADFLKDNLHTIILN
jgi:protein phosphatase 2C family protein 2/3